LAAKFKAPAKALSIRFIGQTVELRNTSKAQIRDIEIKSSPGESPAWIKAINDSKLVLEADQSAVFFSRGIGGGLELSIGWRDVANVQHHERVMIEDGKK
jgi:hypothetical protein